MEYEPHFASHRQREDAEGAQGVERGVHVLDLGEDDVGLRFGDVPPQLAQARG